MVDSGQDDETTGLSRRSLLGAGVAMAVTSSALAQAAPQKPVVLGQVYLSFYAVTGAVVHSVLERLGHTVEVREGPHEKIFPLLGEGSIDLMAAAWLPEGHAAYWERYGKEALEVTKLYDGARFFWGVPDYVPADAVASIPDLAKPAVASRMAKAIKGIGDGATISVFSRKAVTDYGLDALGYSFAPGTQASWTGAFDDAVKQRQWIVFPTWAPQYLNLGGKIRPLADPKGVLGGENRAVLVAPRTRWGDLPPRTKAVLQRVHLSLDAVTEMDGLVNVQKMTPRQAADRWLSDHPRDLADWMSATG